MKISIYSILLLKLMLAQSTDYEKIYDDELKTSVNSYYRNKFQNIYQRFNQQFFTNNELTLPDLNEPIIGVNSNNRYYYAEQIKEFFKKFYNIKLFSEEFEWNFLNYWPMIKSTKLDAIYCLDALQDLTYNSSLDSIINIGDTCSGAFKANLQGMDNQKVKKAIFKQFRKSLEVNNKKTNFLEIYTKAEIPKIAIAVSCDKQHKKIIKGMVKKWNKEEDSEK